MDGLECSEIKRSELEFSERIDSEYYQKKYLCYQSLVENCSNFMLGEKATFLIGPFGSAYSTENYVENSDYRYVRGQDVKPFALKNDEARYMAEDDFHRLEKYALKQDDILVSVVGTLGNACIVQSKDIPGIFSCKSTVVRTDSINPYFLLAYLNSKIGRDLLLRKERGAIQKGLNLGDLNSLLVPDFTDILQNKIERIIKQALKDIMLSKTAFGEAERVLVAELGIPQYTSVSNTVSVKLLSNSFSITGRLDAEYYQPQYEVVEKILKSNKYDLLKDICELINYGTVPTSPYTEDGSGVPYIKGMNLKNTQIAGALDRIENVESLADRFYTKEGDIIISQMGTVGDIGVVSKETENMLFASFTIRARLNKNCGYNPLYVGLYIQKVSKKWYLLRNIAQASVRQNTDLPTIKNMYIPKLDMSIQNEIADYIKKSFDLLEKSEQLFEYAKHAVEIAIEQGEDKAMEWLKEKGVES